MMATAMPLRDEPRPLPQNLEAEQALLGAVLVNNRAYDVVSGVLEHEHFSDEFHARLWRAIAREIGAGHEASPVTLRPYVADEPDAGYVARLAAAAISALPENLAEYARAIRQAWLARRIIGASLEATDTLHARYDGEAIDRIAADMQDALDAARADATERRPVSSIADAAARALEQSGDIQKAREEGRATPIVETGIAALDKLIGGLFPGQFVVAAGATGMGKSSLALSIAEHEARAGGTVAFFSLEMESREIAQRSLAAMSGVPIWAIRRGMLKPDQWDRLDEATAAFRELPLLIDDNPASGIPDIRRIVKQTARKSNLRLIVVDYIQLVLSDGRSDNRALEVARVTRGLKQLAGELGIPVLALSQLSRQVDARDDKRPQLSDLRESGSIEQDADVVMFCYRPGYYQERKKPQRLLYGSKAAYDEAIAGWETDIRVLDGEAEIIVAKQRQGPANQSAKVRFDRNAVRFVDLAEETQQGMEF